MKKIKATSFSEMIESGQKKLKKSIEHVKKTGLCSNCEKEKVAKDELRCQTCIDKTEEILKKLRGPGFSEFKIPVQK